MKTKRKILLQLTSQSTSMANNARSFPSHQDFQLQGNEVILTKANDHHHHVAYLSGEDENGTDKAIHKFRTCIRSMRDHGGWSLNGKLCKAPSYIWGHPIYPAFFRQMFMLTIFIYIDALPSLCALLCCSRCFSCSSS